MDIKFIFAIIIGSTIGANLGLLMRHRMIEKRKEEEEAKKIFFEVDKNGENEYYR